MTDDFKTDSRSNEEIKNDIDARNEHTDRLYYNDDLGISVWANGMNNQRDRLILQLRENDGKFQSLGLFDLEGRRVRAKEIQTQYGMAWAFCDEHDRFTGKFISSRPARESTMRKKGYVEEFEMAPGKPYMVGGEGRGTGAMCSTYYTIIRDDKGYPEDAIVVR